MDYYSLKRKELQDLCKKHNLPANVTNLNTADNLSALLKPGPTERIFLSLPPSLPGYLVTEEMDYYSLKRKELQDLCKKHNLPANVTNLKMADSLSALLKVSEKVEKRTISSLIGSGSGSSGIGGDTKVAKTIRFLDQEKPNEGPVSKVTYQPEETVSESGSRRRRKSLRRERSSSDCPDSEETEAVREKFHETSRSVTRSQVAKATDAMAESEQEPGNGIGGDTKVAKTVRFLDQEKPNEVPIPDVTYQPEKIVSESGPRTRRKSLLCTKRSSSDRPHSEETEAVPENHEILRRITRSQAEKAEDTMAESEQAPAAEKEVNKRTRKPKKEKKADKAIHRVEEPCPIVVTVLSSSEEDGKNAGKGDDVEKMIAPEIACKEPTVRSPRSHRVTTPAKGNECEASNEEALKVNEQQQNSHNRRKTRNMMEKAEEETQSDGKVLISEPHAHTRAKDAKTKASAEITCENGVNSKYSADLKAKEEILPEYGGYRVCNTSARTRSRKKLGGAAEGVSCGNKENGPVLRRKPSRTSRQAAAQKNESANFLEGDSRKSKIGNELQQAAEIDKATEQIKRCASQKQAHGSTDEAGEVQEDRVDYGNKILKRSEALKRRKERIVRFKKGLERQGDPLTSDCEGDQEDNADKVEAAEASATHEIMEAATTGVFLSSSNEETQMKYSGKELQNLGDVKHVHRRKAERNSLQQNHNLEDIEIVEENNGLESISTQCEDLDPKISLSILDVDQTKITEDTDDRKEMKEDMELIERRGSEIASEHENTLTNLSDQEQDTSQLHDQHVTDVYSVDEGLVHEKKDEQLIDQHSSPCGRANLQPGEYNCSEKEKGSLLDKSVVASETALTSPNRKTIPYLPNVNVELQYQMAVVVDEAIRKDGLFDEMHEVLDEEKETLKGARTVPETLISDRVPGAGLRETSATNAQFASDNNADAELIGSKEIVLDYVSSCMAPMSPAKEQSELGDFMSNGCSSDELKDHNDDTIPKSISRPHLELTLGVDAVAESKDKQDIINYSALMNKIISASSEQNDTGKSMTSLAITNIDVLNGTGWKEVEDANCTDEMVSEDIENENGSPAFTKETRYHGLTKDIFRETSQTEAQELREILVPKCGSDASPIITTMLHSDPDEATGGQRGDRNDNQASQLRDEVVAPKSSCVAELDSEASEVPLFEKEKEDKGLMIDLSSENISTESCHVFGGATYGGRKNICDGCKESSSETQATDPVSESEHVTNADTAMVKKQKEMDTDMSRKESNLEDMEYPKDEKFLISYDLSQAISDESQCRATGCVMDPSAMPASDGIEKHTEATFPIEAFSEGHQNEYGSNQHISEVSKVKKTTCSSSDDEEIKAYDKFDMNCDDSGSNVNKSSGSFNYFEEVDNGGEKFSFYSGVTEDEGNDETAHEEFDQKHGNETFIRGDIRLPHFEYDAHSFEGSESDIGSECTTEAHDAEQDSIKDDADIWLTTFRSGQFLFHKLTSQHGISTNTDTVLEYNQQTKSIPKKAATAAEGIKGCTSVRKVSEDVPDSYERNSSLVKEKFSEVDENAKLILHESHMEEGNHHFPVTEISQDVPQIGEHKGCMETTDAAADQQKVELASWSELQELVQSPQRTFKEPGFDNCAVEGVMEMNKFVFEKYSQTEPEGAQDKNGTVESCSEDLSLEDAVVVHTPVTEYQHVQRFKKHKNHNEIMDVDANQEAVVLVNQRELQEAEERSQSASKERDLDQCIIDMKQVNKFALEEHDQTEPERVHGKNGTVEYCSEDLSLEDAVAVLTPVTKFCHHVQQFKERKDHNETMDADANQSMVVLANQRELQEIKEGTQIVPKELHLDQCAVDVKQVNTFVLEEHDQSELEGVQDKNGTVESCTEDLSLEDAVAFPTPVTEFHHHIQQFEEYKDHSETMDADANQPMVELANQRELQAIDEGTQSASKELHDNHCSIDVKQVNKFVLENHNLTEPEEAQNQNEIVESSTLTLGQDVTITVHMPVEKVCQYVLQTKGHKKCRETMDMDGDRQKVELINQGELQEVDDRAQNASKEAKLDYCAVKSVEQVNKFAFQEHNQMGSEGAPDKNEDAECSSPDLRTEDQIVVYTPLKEIKHRDCRETMNADSDEQKVELANWEVRQEVEDSTQSSSNQLGIEGAQDKKETVEHRSHNLSPLAQTVVKEMSPYVLWTEEHKDCKETIDPVSDRQRVELAHENEHHQEGEESIRSSPKVPRLDACAVENFKEAIKFAVEEHDQTESDEAQDRNEVVQSSSQNLSPEDATSFKEEDMKGTENDQNEDGTEISQLADVEEAEGITASSPLNPSLEGARVIHEERREETSNSEGEDWRKTGKIELTENVTDESCEEKEQLSRTKTTVLEVGFVKAYFQEKPENVGMSSDLKDKELRNGDNRENIKANEASPQDINVEDREANIIKESFYMETVAHANGEIAGVEDMEKRGNDEGDHSSYQPKSTEDGIENDELVYPERKGNDDANSPNYLSKLYEDGKENDEVAQFHPVEAELNMNLGGPPSGTDEINDICNLMSMTLKITVPPPETSLNTGQGASPMRLTDEEAAEGVEAVSPVPAPTEPETTSLAHLPSQKPKPTALTVVEKATVAAETMMSPARRRNDEAPKENTPSLTIRTKITVVKEKRETATKTLTAVRRRPLQAIPGNNGEGFHSRLDFTR